MYRVVNRFRDLTDPKKPVYEAGDKYPREGYTPADGRFEELSGTVNKAHKKLIEFIDTPKKAVPKAVEVRAKKSKSKK